MLYCSLVPKIPTTTQKQEKNWLFNRETILIICFTYLPCGSRLNLKLLLHNSDFFLKVSQWYLVHPFFKDKITIWADNGKTTSKRRETDGVTYGSQAYFGGKSRGQQRQFFPRSYWICIISFLPFSKFVSTGKHVWFQTTNSKLETLKIKNDWQKINIGHC